MIRIAAALSAVVLISAPAVARDTAKIDAQAVVMVHNYGKCIAARTPGGAEKVLAMDFDSRAYQTALKKITQGHDYCLNSGKLGGNGVLFAAAMAEAVLMHDADGLAERLTWREGSAPIKARGELEAVGLCLVRKDPQATVKLLGTDPMSGAETKALQSITPFLSECVANGQQFRVNRPGLRAQVALAAYRITHMPAGS